MKLAYALSSEEHRPLDFDFYAREVIPEAEALEARTLEEPVRA
jgi:hypothetical protein